MSFSKLSVMEDARELVLSSKGKHIYTVDFELLIGDDVHRVNKVLAINTNRDFIGNKFDSITIDVIMGLGTWLHEVVPNRSNIRARLIRTPTTLTMTNGQPVGAQVTTEYKVIVEDTSNELVSTSNEATQSRSMANETKMIPMTFTIISDTVNLLRTAQLTGWFLKSVMGTTLRGLFLNYGVKRIPSKEQYLAGDYEGVVGVQMVPPDNTKEYAHTYLPEGTPLRKLPQVLQEINGIYNHGIANYLHKGLWYIYPITDTTRFESSPRRVSIFNIPPEKMYGIDKTFAFKEKELNIIATGKMQVKDSSELSQFNKGSTVRIAASSNIMDSYLNIDADGNLVGSRENNIMEGSLEKRADGLNMMREGLHITGNTCLTLSELNKGAVSEYFIEWHNSDASLITPGMPARIYYLSNNQAQHIDGIIAGVDTREHLPDNSVGKAALITVSMIRIIGERVKKGE